MKAEDRVKSLEDTISTAIANLEFLKDFLTLAENVKQDEKASFKLLGALIMTEVAVDCVIGSLDTSLL